MKDSKGEGAGQPPVPDAFAAFLAKYSVPAAPPAQPAQPVPTPTPAPAATPTPAVAVVTSAAEAAAAEFWGVAWKAASPFAERSDAGAAVQVVPSPAEPPAAVLALPKSVEAAINAVVADSDKRPIIERAKMIAKLGVLSQIVLSPDQTAAQEKIAEVARGMKDKNGGRVRATAILVGPAGTGKTTLVRSLVVEFAKPEYGFEDVMLLAPTGKAASRMTEVLGVRASTIHRVLYGSFQEAAFLRTRYDRIGETWITELLDENRVTIQHEPALASDITLAKSLGASENNMGWEREIGAPLRAKAEKPAGGGRKQLHFGDAHEPCDDDTLIVVDEASLVSATVHRHLVENLPRGTMLLYVGDREQLPPVNETWGPDLQNPTAALTTVHRQALDNPILRIATDLRAGKGIAPDLVRTGDFMSVLLNRRATVDMAAQWLAGRRSAGIDATLACFTNGMRQTVNARVRAFRGHPADQVVVRDFMLVRANNHDFGYMSGEVYEIVELRDRGESIMVRFRGRESDCMSIRKEFVGREQSEFRRWVMREIDTWERLNMGDIEAGRVHRIFDNPARRYVHVDHGEILTVHSTQGAEYQEVGIVWEKGLWGMKHKDPEFLRRWSYTAVTRARNRLALFLL